MCIAIGILKMPIRIFLVGGLLLRNMKSHIPFYGKQNIPLKNSLSNAPISFKLDDWMCNFHLEELCICNPCLVFEVHLETKKSFFLERI